MTAPGHDEILMRPAQSLGNSQVQTEGLKKLVRKTNCMSFRFMPQPWIKPRAGSPTEQSLPGPPDAFYRLGRGSSRGIEVPHLATDTGLGLAVEVELDEGIFERGSPVGFLPWPRGGRGDWPWRQAASNLCSPRQATDGADLLLELAGHAGVNGRSAQSCESEAQAR